MSVANHPAFRDSPNGAAGPSVPRQPLTFIHIPNPEAIRDRSKVRTARAHAVAVGLARKRLRARNNGSNFLTEKFAEDENKKNVSRELTQNTPLPSPSGSIGSSSVDPFDTLSVNARRLTTLLHLRSSLHAGEPVFSVHDAIHHSNLQSTFGASLNDGALTAALCLTLSSAANSWRMNDECFMFSSIALQQINQKMTDPAAAVSSASIGCILLLLGNAYRLGELQTAQAHLKGLGTLLHMCAKSGCRLSVALKQAIYWQDLFSSIFLGTDRIVSYAKFWPNQQSTIEHVNPVLCPPPGFARSAHLLSPEFLFLVGDVVNLYADRERWFTPDEVRDSKSLDDFQARLEDGLHSLRQVTEDSILQCCIIATQLCVYGFWVGTWNSALIPRELSTQLLRHLRSCQQHKIEDDSLLFWLVNVGKAFAVDEHVRSGFDDLWFKRHHSKSEAMVLTSWHDAEAILADFIWSEVLCSGGTDWFWTRIRE